MKKPMIRKWKYVRQWRNQDLQDWNHCQSRSWRGRGTSWSANVRPDHVNLEHDQGAESESIFCYMPGQIFCKMSILVNQLGGIIHLFSKMCMSWKKIKVWKDIFFKISTIESTLRLHFLIFQSHVRNNCDGRLLVNPSFSRVFLNRSLKKSTKKLSIIFPCFLG